MLCVASLTVAALGSWTYAGFLAEPSPPSPPASNVASAIIELSRFDIAPRSTTSNVPEVAPRLEPPRQPNFRSAPPVVPRAPVETVRFRMADQFGQVWEHSDPGSLQAFVLDRNRRLVRMDRRFACVGSACR